MTKTRQNNDMTDPIGVVYVEIETEVLWSIRKDVVYHES